MHSLAQIVHGRARQRHPVLPADQVADTAPFSLVDSQGRAIAAHPYQPLAMGGDELAVVEWGLTRSERQLVVIEALPYAFVRTDGDHRAARSEEHTSELQSLMRTSYAVFCLKKKTHIHDRKLNSP